MRQPDEICIARKITNTYYIGPYDSNGTAVMVVSGCQQPD